MGLTGGIGSGKSAALETFRRLGAAVMSSDEVVHACYLDPDVVAAVRTRFGREMIDESGQVDRAALGVRVFASAEDRRFLEGLIHPRIQRAREAWIATERARQTPAPLLVCEVPLLFEAGLVDRFDAVLVVTASEAIRRARVDQRGQDFAARAAGQISEQHKIDNADSWFVNDGERTVLDNWVSERFTEFARH